MLYNVSGTVTDTDENPLVRKVFLINRSTGVLIDATESDSAGNYSLYAGSNDPVLVVAVPNGDGGNAKVFDSVIPDTFTPAATVNHIGTPGSQAFGLGICPDLPAGFEALNGTFEPTSDEYGNYKYSSDGSIVVWIPAFFYKWGTGANGLALNEVDIKPLSHFADVATGNAAGYAMHRAFYDEDELKDGFFIDKYHCTYNADEAVISSKPNEQFFRCMTHYPNLSLFGFGSGLNAYIDVCKLRGSDWFAASVFQYGALKMLAYAHGEASSDRSQNAWYDVTYNYPRGNVQTFGRHPRENPMFCVTNGSVDFWTATTIPDVALTSHNGQKCGVMDIGGLVFAPAFGLTYESSNFRALKKSVGMRTLTSGSSSSTDINGTAALTSVYDNIGANISATATVTGFRYPDPAQQWFSETVTETDLGYIEACSWFYQASGVTATKNYRLGASVYLSKTNQGVPLVGASYAVGSTEDYGFFLSYFAETRTASNAQYGIRSAYYIPPSP